MDKLDELNKAIKSNLGQSNRSEKIKDYSKLFVEPIITSTLETNANQIVFGRRGTGKTMLFGTLNEKINRELGKNKVVSFYYSATDFRNSPEFGNRNASPKEKAHVFFNEFIIHLSNEVFNFADTLLKMPHLWKFYGLADNGSGQRKRELFINYVWELLETAQYGSDFIKPDILNKINKNDKKTKDLRGLVNELSIENKIDLTRLFLGLSGEIKNKNLTPNEKNTINKIAYSAKKGFAPKKIKGTLVKIINLLELDYITIFIDEWMSLEESQMDFADKLKKSLFGEKKISIKIAADQYQSVFNNNGSGHNFRGLELGADIFEAVDLDLPFRDIEKQYDLYSETLYLRLSYWNPKIQDNFGDLENVNYKYFIDSIFYNRRAFIELCNASQGICRDFHTLFQRCSRLIKTNLKYQKINIDIVTEAIAIATQTTFKSIVESIDSNELLVKVISPHIMKSASRYFMVEKPTKNLIVLKDLLSKRIIHPISSLQVHATLTSRYDCFELAYGIYINLMIAREYSTGEDYKKIYDPLEVYSISSTNINDYLLNLKPFEGTESIILCPNCTNEFSSLERCYDLEKLCPNCFKIVE